MKWISGVVHGDWPLCLTPNMGNKLKADQEWIAENGCYNAKTFVGEDAWFAWLGSPKLLAHQATCLFATAPDVVGDADATWERSKPWLPKIRALGYKAAFVAQDGMEEWLEMPWEDCDVLFIGGTDAFKLADTTYDLVREAKAAGLWVHVGRVNSLERALAFKAVGADSADGTVLAFDPQRPVERWQADLDRRIGMGI